MWQRISGKCLIMASGVGLSKHGCLHFNWCKTLLLWGEAESDRRAELNRLQEAGRSSKEEKLNKQRRRRGTEEKPTGQTHAVFPVLTSDRNLYSTAQRSVPLSKSIIQDSLVIGFLTSSLFCVEWEVEPIPPVTRQTGPHNNNNNNHSYSSHGQWWLCEETVVPYFLVTPEYNLHQPKNA